MSLHHKFDINNSIYARPSLFFCGVSRHTITLVLLLLCNIPCVGIDCTDGIDCIEHTHMESGPHVRRRSGTPRNITRGVTTALRRDSMLGRRKIRHYQRREIARYGFHGKSNRQRHQDIRGKHTVRQTRTSARQCLPSAEGSPRVQISGTHSRLPAQLRRSRQKRHTNLLALPQPSTNAGRACARPTSKPPNYTLETTSALSPGHLPTVHMEPYSRAQTRPTHQYLTSIHFLPKNMPGTQTACTKPYARNLVFPP